METMSTDLPSEIHAELSSLSSTQQLAVLEYLRQLKKSPKGMTGAELLNFAGTLSEAEANEIRRSVERDCSKVDSDEW